MIKILKHAHVEICGAHQDIFARLKSDKRIKRADLGKMRNGYTGLAVGKKSMSDIYAEIKSGFAEEALQTSNVNMLRA